MVSGQRPDGHQSSDQVLAKHWGFVCTTCMWMVMCCPLMAADPVDTIVRPFVTKHCLSCHDATRTKGDLDLSPFVKSTQLRAHTDIWQEVVATVRDHDMPPKKATSQPTQQERQLLVKTVEQLIGVSKSVASELTLAADDPRVLRLKKEGRAYLEAHCIQCHGSKQQKGDIRLDHLQGDLGARAGERRLWRMVVEQVETGQMPPVDHPQPAAAENKRVAVAIHAGLDAIGQGLALERQHPNKGNYLSHAELFDPANSGKGATSARVWRLNPIAFSNLLERRFAIRHQSEHNLGSVAAPFTLTTEAGLRDYSYRYTITGAEARQAQLAARAVLTRLLKPKWDNKKKKYSWNQTPMAKLIIAKATSIDVKSADDIFAYLFQRLMDRTPTKDERQRYGDFLQQQVGTLGLREGMLIGLQPVFLHPEVLFRVEKPAVIDGDSGRLSWKDQIRLVTLALLDGPVADRDRGHVAKILKGKEGDEKAFRLYVHWLLQRRPEQQSKRRFMREFFGYPGAVDVFKDPNDLLLAGIKKWEPQKMVEYADKFVDEQIKADKQILRNLLMPIDRPAPKKQSKKKNKNKKADKKSQAQKATSAKPAKPVPVAKRNAARGLLSRDAWLVAFSANSDNHAIKRGHWIREHLLGGQLADVPINVPAQLPVEPDSTLRHRMRVTREASCWKCHRQMDPLGLPFEMYDHFGRRRSKELGRPVDSSGAITGSGSEQVDGKVANALELVTRIADSERAHQVFVRYAFRFYMGRNETLADAGTIQAAYQAFKKNDYSLNALITALVTSRAFTHRTVVP